MVPTLKIPNGSLEANGFINAFIHDSHREEQYEDSVYLLFKPDNIEEFDNFLADEHERTKSLIDDYDLNGHVVLVYTLDSSFKRDFDIIKTGKYSKTSLRFRNLFPKKVRPDGDRPLMKESLQHRIFKRSADLKGLLEHRIGFELVDGIEVWEGYDLERETLKL